MTIHQKDPAKGMSNYKLQFCGCHGGVIQNYSLLKRDTTLMAKWFLTFQKIFL